MCAYDVIVVGGGIVGSSCAYHLAKADVNTLLLDRNDSARATDAGAGVISPPTSSGTDSDDWFDFAIDAHAYYPALVAALEREQGGPTGYDSTGLLAVAIDDDELERFDETLSRIETRQQQIGYPEADSIEVLDAEAACDRFPPLESPRKAFYYANAARVNGPALASALRRAGIAHDLAVEDGDVTAIETTGGLVAGVETADGRTIDADSVIVAGGAWSATFENQLGVWIPVEPQRGQIVHLQRSGGETGDWPIAKGFRGHYIVPWSDDRLVVGATRETGSGFDARTTASGIQEVLDEALRVAPDLADTTVDEIRAGLRPISRDGLPIVGSVPGVSGAYLATGHGATGLQLGPYSGKVLADTVRESTDKNDFRAFSVGRFGQRA